MEQEINKESFQPKRTFHFSKDVQINFEKSGERGPSIIFLHGFGASLVSWYDIKDALPKGFQLYLLDLKGFGYSSKPKDGKYSMLDQAEIIEGFILTYNLDQVILVGHSYGGGIALGTYLNFHNKKYNPIKKIVLIDSAGYTQKFPFFINYLRTPIINFLLFNLVPSKIRAEGLLERLFHDDSKVTKERILRYSFFYDMPESHYSFAQAAKQILPKNYKEKVKQIKLVKVPTLIIWGRNDPIIPVKDAFKFEKDISNAQVQIVENCGHIPHEENPEETAKILEEFLSIQ